MANRYKNVADGIPITATKVYTNAEFVSVAGRIGITEGLSPNYVGDPVNVRIEGQVESDAPSTLVLADGDSVLVDVATNAVVASGGTKAGACIGGKLNGETTVRYLLEK